MSNEPVVDAELLVKLAQNGYSFIVRVRGRGICGVGRLVYTVGLFYGLGELDYQGRYCYESLFEAINDLTCWDGTGDPPGDWIKHKGVSGEYSNPNYQKQ
jgi:hypothetical protein